MKITRIAGAVVAALAVTLAAAACGGGTSSTSKTATPAAPATKAAAAITVEGAWARKSTGAAMTTPAGGMTTPAGGMMTPAAAGDRGAAFMVIKNSGAATDALIGASSDVATATEVHETVMQGDQAIMRPVARIDVPAGGQVELKPGGYHIMFIGLKQPLQTGTRVTVDLRFEKAGVVTVEAEVREQ
jgi:copper(I)-binding protein